MTLLQVTIGDELKEAIATKSKEYGVPATSLVRIALVKTFLPQGESPENGNIFNANRDNDGKGIAIDDLIAAL